MKLFIAATVAASAYAGNKDAFKGKAGRLPHGWNKAEGAENLGKWDRFMAEQLGYFIQRLASADEQDGSVLDNSLVLYGSSNSQTHNNNNYPLILAGGKQLGLQHGRFLKYGPEVPMSNLLLTMLNCLNVERPAFADSTADLSDLLSA